MESLNMAGQFSALKLLACANCKNRLERDIYAFACKRCGLHFDAEEEFVDMRLQRDRSMASDRIAPLREAFHLSSYSDLLATWSNWLPNTTPQMREISKSYTAEGPQRATARLYRAWEMAATLRWTVGRGVALDIGCGSGGSFEALSKEFRMVIGCDISPESLVLSKKLVLEKNLCNVSLVCASAVALPFPDESFDFVLGIDFLHHLLDPLTALLEIRRVLKTGGVTALDSANRYTLMGSEPHVKLWGVGFLPRVCQELYVHWRLGISYNNLQARLMSTFELLRLLKASFGNNFNFYSPLFWKTTPRRFGEFILWSRHRIKRLTWLAHCLFIALIPNHEVLARKSSAYLREAMRG
jgi:ubiquinone/menaquinone biosynthesis C-methylase UbiE